MHISELALFDYLAGTTDLSTQETEHIQECDDCRNQAIELRQIIQETGDIAKARRFLIEERNLPFSTQSPIDTPEDQL